MAPQVHPVVQDATDLNDPTLNDPVNQEVTSAAAVPGSVERADARHDVVACLRSGDVRTVREFADRLKERVPIDPGLPRAEILCRPFEDVCEIEFCGSAKANAPSPLGHEGSFTRSGNDLFGEIVQISLEPVDAVKFLELASIQRPEACASRLPQDLQLCGILSLALLDQTQTLAKDLARILVTAGADQSLNDFLLMLRQHDVSGWNRHALRWLIIGIICHSWFDRASQPHYAGDGPGVCAPVSACQPIGSFRRPGKRRS